MTDTLDETAQQIADHGREALMTRLRPAFQEAAAAHSDVLDLAPEQLDAMVERAVERADGLQWRRALASVATEQLGISLGEALAHPAVARAQELAGAPSYEESLAQLGPLPGAPARPAVDETEAPPVTEAEASEDEIEAPPGSGVEGTDEDDDELASANLGVADVADDESLPDDPEAGTLAPPPPSEEELAETAGEPEPVDRADDDADTGASAEQLGTPPKDVRVVEPNSDSDAVGEPDAGADPVYAGEYPAAPTPSTAEYEALRPYEDDEDYVGDDALRVAVIHLGGIANLAPSERNIELQMSEDGLDIVRGGGEILGRLDWNQVKALEVPEPRGRRRMRRGASTHLIVRTARGDASFEVPEVTPPELQQHLAPIVARHIRAE